MNLNTRTFLELSAELTGYSATDLEGTGLVDVYQPLLEQQVGPTITALLYSTARRVLAHESEEARAHHMKVEILASPQLWPVCAMLTSAWYLGAWTCLPASWYAFVGEPVPKGLVPGSTSVPTAMCYVQQLSFRGAGAHPPGALPTGHGSWGIPPVFGDIKAPREVAS